MSSHEDLSYTPRHYDLPPLPDDEIHGTPPAERPLNAPPRVTAAPNGRRPVSLIAFFNPPSSWFSSVSVFRWSLPSGD
jgi:hypothetical protein